MDQEQVMALRMMRGIIAGLPQADREGVELAATKIREIVLLHNDHGQLALALVCLESE